MEYLTLIGVKTLLKSVRYWHKIQYINQEDRIELDGIKLNK